MTAVTLLIPAWQAETFIDRTLDAAQAQDHDDLRILVSVDVCDDRTADICRQRAAGDDRFEVFVQQQRLRWFGNSNFLMQKVRTPYFGFLWHDDTISPDYARKLAAALDRRDDATSVIANQQHWGESEWLERPAPIEGTTCERLVRTFCAPNHVSLPRTLMRREIIDQGLHIPDLHGRDHFENNNGLTWRIVACGPVIHEPGTEYQRFNGGGQSIVDGWRRMDWNDLLEGVRASARFGIDLVEEVLEDEDERRAAIYGLYLFLIRRLRFVERERRHDALTAPGHIAAEFGPLPHEPIMERVPPALVDAVRGGQAALFFEEGLFWRDHENWPEALPALAAAAALNPDHPWAGRVLATALYKNAHPAEGRAVAERFPPPEQRA